MNNFETYESREDFLQHHGILGQKWGIRRYQNPDGTLTKAGKKRLESKHVMTREEKVITYATSNTKAFKTNIDQFTNDEIDAFIERVNKTRFLNKKLSDNDLDDSYKKGKDLARDISERSDTLTTIVDKAGQAYNSVAKVFNAINFKNEDRQLPIFGKDYYEQRRQDRQDAYNRKKDKEDREYQREKDSLDRAYQRAKDESKNESYRDKTAYERGVANADRARQLYNDSITDQRMSDAYSNMIAANNKYERERWMSIYNTLANNKKKK